MIAPASRNPMQCVADKLNPLETEKLIQLRKELFEDSVTEVPDPWSYRCDDGFLIDDQGLSQIFEKYRKLNPKDTLMQMFGGSGSGHRSFTSGIKENLIDASNEGNQTDVINVIKFYIHITRVNSVKGHFHGRYSSDLPYLLCPLLLKLGFTTDQLNSFGLSN